MEDNMSKLKSTTLKLISDDLFVDMSGIQEIEERVSRSFLALDGFAEMHVNANSGSGSGSGSGTGSGSTGFGGW
jgi:hypothetical protein